MNGSKPIADIQIPDKKLVEQMIVLPVEVSGTIRLKAGASARARVLLDYTFPGEAKELNVDIEFLLEAGACLDVFHMAQGEFARGTVASKSVYRLKKHASLNVVTFVGGGDLCRMEHEARFEEPHGFAAIKGLSILSGASQAVHKVNADHAVGHCISRQFYKSIVTGSAKTSFESLVKVAKGAEKSDSKQLNKNLILSKDAQASSRPELKILADDVACAHGSATGELDPDQLFYMRSRGIEERAARFMLIEGFAAEVLNEVSEVKLKDLLRGSLKTRIQELIASK